MAAIPATSRASISVSLLQQQDVPSRAEAVGLSGSYVLYRCHMTKQAAAILEGIAEPRSLTATLVRAYRNFPAARHTFTSPKMLAWSSLRGSNKGMSSAGSKPIRDWTCRSSNTAHPQPGCPYCAVLGSILPSPAQPSMGCLHRAAHCTGVAYLLLCRQT